MLSLLKQLFTRRNVAAYEVNSPEGPRERLMPMQRLRKAVDEGRRLNRKIDNIVISVDAMQLVLDECKKYDPVTSAVAQSGIVSMTFRGIPVYRVVQEGHVTPQSIAMSKSGQVTLAVFDDYHGELFTVHGCHEFKPNS